MNTPEDSSRPAPNERARARHVILFMAALTVVVMGAVIALGLDAEDPPKGPRAPGQHPDRGLGDLYGKDRPAEEGFDEGCAFDAERPPRVVFDLPPTGLEFGAVKQGVQLDREVVFRNEGSGPLCVRRVEAGCGCIKAKLVDDVRRYEPGAEGRIQIRLDTKGREGLQKKTITLYTNAVDVPLQKFVVRASITLGMRVGPSFVNFGRVTAGTPAEAKIRLRTPKDDADWTITSVEGTREVDGSTIDYQWTVKDIPDQRDLVKELIVVHPGVGKVDTSFQDSIVIHTTHPDRSEFKVRAHLLVVKPILAVPPRAVLGFVPSTLPPARVRLLAGDASVSFKVTEVVFELPDGSAPGSAGSGFEATSGASPAGEPWVEVRYDGKDRAAGPLRATMVVRTNLDRMPEVRIECYATVE